jgi:hypothetical protein
MAERAAEPLQIISELLLCNTISSQNSFTIYNQSFTPRRTIQLKEGLRLSNQYPGLGLLSKLRRLLRP